MKSRFILGVAGILAFVFLAACPNQLMRDLVEQKLASPTADTFIINAGAPTASLAVTLNSKVAKSNDALQMRFRNEGGAWTEWQPYADSFPWTIPIGDAIKTVYAEFRDEGHHVVSMSGAIQLDTGAPVGPGFYAWGTGIAVGQQHNWINSTSTTLMMNVAGANRMRFSNTPVAGNSPAWDASGALLQPYAASAAWTLAPGDGANTIFAQFLDAANNASYFSYAITLDTSAPTVGTALSINSGAAAVFVLGVSLSASVSDNIATAAQIYAEYQNDGEGWSSRAVIALPQAWSLRNAAGMRTVNARFTDIAGNSIQSSATIELSSGVPAPSAATPTNDTTPTWSWPPVTGAAEYQVKLNGGGWTSNGTSTSYTPATPLSMGSHTLYVQARDSVNNWSASGSFIVVLNTSGPGAPVVSSTPAATNNPRPTWTWSSGGFGNGTYRYKLDDSNLDTGATQTSALNVTWSSSLSDGTHSLYVQEQDAATNWSPAGSFAVTVDTIAPVIPVRTMLSSNPAYPGYARAGDVIMLNITVSEGGAGLSGLPIATFNGHPADFIAGAYPNFVAQYTVAMGDPEGLVAFFLSVADLAGNTTSSTALSSGSPVLVDTTHPTGVLSCNDPDLIVQTGQSVTYMAIFSEPVFNPTMTITGLFTAAPMVGAGTNWTYDWTVPGGFSGTVPVVVNASDAAGNPNGAPTGATSLTIITTPSVSTYAPDNIHATYAFGYGSVSSDGGAPVTERGLCWSVNPSPTIADAHIASGSGTGMFTATISGLTLGTTYYVRAYATNSVGTAYYNQITFQTLFDLAVGESYAGGVIFTISGTYPNQHGKVATVHDSVQTVYRLWSVTTGTTGATSTTDGAANTTTIYANQGTSGAVYAARYCEEYTGGGYTDWYLPAQDELALLWTNRAGIISSGGYWWSSTEMGTTTARVIYWPDGSQTTMSKIVNNCWVCPIRAF